MTKISIVLAYNNQLELTSKCLDNLQAVMQEEPEYQYDVIVVNGGNKEDIEHPVITQLIRLDTNEGFTKVLNHGLKAIADSSSHVLFTANDCFLPLGQKAFTRFLLSLEDTGCKVVSPTPDNPNVTVYDHLMKGQDERHRFYDFFPTITWFFRAELLTEVGLLDENFPGVGMYSDNDWALRVGLKYGTPAVAVIKGLTMHHKLSSESGAYDVNANMNIGRTIYENKWG